MGNLISVYLHYRYYSIPKKLTHILNNQLNNEQVHVRFLQNRCM